MDDGTLKRGETEHSLGLPGGEQVLGAAKSRVRWPVVFVLVLPLIVLNCGWIANSEMLTGVTEVTISSLFMGVTFVLFVLTLVNLAVRRFVRRVAALNQAEMMAVYSLLSVSSVVAGVGHFGFFTPFLTNAFYYGATSDKDWQAFWQLLPGSIGPRDPTVLHGFYNGNSTFFHAANIRAWSGPILIWCLFFLALLWTTICLAAILRRRWDDEEHLPFPVIAVPLEMTREGAPLYRSRLLWLGFAIPCLLHSLNSLHSIYPTLPFLPINSVRDMVSDFGLQRPWSGAGTLFYNLHPAGIGFGYLVNTDVSFSLWFFYLLRKAVLVAATAWGWHDVAGGLGAETSNQFPYISSQGCGAWLVLGLATLWTGRSYFRSYVRRALHGDPAGADAREPLSARLAVGGFIVGYLGLCAFVWSWGGVWWLPVAFLAIYLVLMITLSRIRAEMAVVSSELLWISPQVILPAIVGTSNLSHLDLTHMAALSWFNSDYRANGMPHELEALAGFKRTRASMRPLVPALLVAAAVAMAAAALWDLQMYYVYGAATANVNSWRIDMGSAPWHALQGWLQNPKPPDAPALGAMAVGMGVTLLLTALRSRFVGFPFYPAAYAMNMSFVNDFFWCDMFAAWVLKAIILRYGGMRLYRQVLPLFWGLILGDFVTGSVWSIIGTIYHLDLFRTFAT